MDLSARSVLLTGASGGIGHAVARRLHAAGARLTLTGRRTEVLEPLAAEVGADMVAADLADRAAVAQLAERCSGIDVLVANAGLPASGGLFSFGVEEIDRTLDVNLRAPIVLARLLGEPMVERGSGHIVLMSSLAGKATSGGASLYSATKFGLRGFGQALRTDLRGTGVGVSVVFPGFVRDAGMFHDSGATLPGFVGTSSPEQVAAAVVDAIVHDRGEVDVAPLSMRAGVKVAELAPTAAAAIAHRIGGARLAGELSHGQRAKR
ncbi:MAG TPA: SDR family NAD(P)-dependent oxidoreductase [Solirubrobacteraceae bacterium]|nr:SDR family NAD(P)-dependent oxidoreductase [Solirubrobacteraceae bacterium]